MEEEYYLDMRVGCIAVRKRVDCEISPGCHPDLPDVVAFWPGRQNTDRDGKFISWEVEQWKSDKALILCNLLNGLSN